MGQSELSEHILRKSPLKACEQHHKQVPKAKAASDEERQLPIYLPPPPPGLSMPEHRTHRGGRSAESRLRRKNRFVAFSGREEAPRAEPLDHKTQELTMRLEEVERILADVSQGLSPSGKEPHEQSSNELHLHQKLSKLEVRVEQLVQDHGQVHLLLEERVQSALSKLDEYSDLAQAVTGQGVKPSTPNPPEQGPKPTMQNSTKSKPQGRDIPFDQSQLHMSQRLDEWFERKMREFDCAQLSRLDSIQQAVEELDSHLDTFEQDLEAILPGGFMLGLAEQPTLVQRLLQASSNTLSPFFPGVTLFPAKRHARTNKNYSASQCSDAPGPCSFSMKQSEIGVSLATSVKPTESSTSSFSTNCGTEPMFVHMSENANQTVNLTKPTRTVCNFCRQTANKLLTCGTCREVVYCTVQCQKNDWSSHRGPCQSAIEFKAGRVDFARDKKERTAEQKTEGVVIYSDPADLSETETSEDYEIDIDPLHPIFADSDFRGL